MLKLEEYIQLFGLDLTAGLVIFGFSTEFIMRELRKKAPDDTEIIANLKERVDDDNEVANQEFETTSETGCITDDIDRKVAAVIAKRSNVNIEEALRVVKNYKNPFAIKPLIK